MEERYEEGCGFGGLDLESPFSGAGIALKEKRARQVGVSRL